MTDKVQQNIDRIRKLAASTAASKGNRQTVAHSQDSLVRVIRNEKEAAIFSAELNVALAMARKR